MRLHVCDVELSSESRVMGVGGGFRDGKSREVFVLTGAQAPNETPTSCAECVDSITSHGFCWSPRLG